MFKSPQLRLLSHRKSARPCVQRREFTGSECLVCIILSGFIGPFSIVGTVTGEVYREKLEKSILPAIREVYGDESIFTFNKMVPHPTTIIVSGSTSMKLFPDDG